MTTDKANDSTSAQRMANQMPSTPNSAGKMNTAAVSNTKVRTVVMVDMVTFIVFSAKFTSYTQYVV